MYASSHSEMTEFEGFHSAIGRYEMRNIIFKNFWG